MGGMKAVIDENTDTAATSTKTAVKSNEGSRPEVIKGKLDLSRKGYGKLSLRYKDAYSTVKFLDLSHNNFKFINGLNLFVNCVELHASHNCLERLSSFLSLRNVVKVLDVSDNVIGNAEHLASLCALVSIDLSNNRIAELCLLDRLTHLTELNLSSNRLHSLPTLHRLSHLEMLNLNANSISSLEHCQRELPRNLKILDVGSNHISDLRQAEHLSSLESLDSLVWAGNPCVRSDSRTFTYRPFLYSCCYTSLRVVDGYSLQEPEIIKGELLCTMSKARRAQTHAELCSVLTKHCPIDVDLCDLSSLSFDDRLFKVMEKRREYLSTTATDESSLSLLDCSRREAHHQKGPKSSDPSLSIDLTADGISEDVSSHAPLCTLYPSTSATLTPGSSPPSASSVTSSSTFVLSHQESHTESISVAKIVQQTNSVDVRRVSNSNNHKIKPSDGTAQRSLRSPRTSSVRGRARRSLTTNKRSSYSAGAERNAATDVIPTYCKSSDKRRETITRAPRGSTNARGGGVSRGRGSGKAPSIKYSPAHIQAAILIQAWWRASCVRRIWRLRLLETRVKRYQKDIRELNSKQLQSDAQLMAISAQCEQLSNIVEQQSNWMSEVTDFVMTAQRKTESHMEELSANICRSMPTPSGLQCTRVSPSMVTVQWDDVQQKGYALYVDGRECGVIRAPLRKGCVQDLDPTKHSTIEVQCVCGELRGQRSSRLVIPPITEVIQDGESIEEDGERIEREQNGLQVNADGLVDVDNVQSDRIVDGSPLQPNTSHQSLHTHIDAQ